MSGLVSPIDRAAWPNSVRVLAAGLLALVTSASGALALADEATPDELSGPGLPRHLAPCGIETFLGTWVDVGGRADKVVVTGGQVMIFSGPIGEPVPLNPQRDVTSATPAQAMAAMPHAVAAFEQEVTTALADSAALCTLSIDTANGRLALLAAPVGLLRLEESRLDAPVVQTLRRSQALPTSADAEDYAKPAR